MFSSDTGSKKFPEIFAIIVSPWEKSEPKSICAAEIIGNKTNNKIKIDFFNILRLAKIG